MHQYLVGHHFPVWCVCFSSDSQTVASGGRAGELKAWYVVTGRLLFNLDQQGAPFVRVEVSPAGDRLTALLFNGDMTVFHLPTATAD